MSAMDAKVELKFLQRMLLRGFDPKTMDFLKWLNYFEYMVDFLHTPVERKVYILLYYMEPLPRAEIQQKVAPTDPLCVPYDELVSHFEEIYGCVRGKFAAEYRFHDRRQMPGEDAISYYICLTKLAKKADHLLKSEQILLLRFIDGLNDEHTKCILRYNTSQSLTFQKTVAMAAMMEFIKLWNR